MTEENKSTTSCPGCGQAIRFPTDRGHIKFPCPGCGAKLEWSPDGRHVPMDVEIESSDSHSGPAIDSTTRFYDALKNHGASTGNSASSPVPPTNSSIPSLPPRSTSLFYLGGSLVAAYGTYLLEKNAGGNIAMFLAFLGVLALTYFLAFRAIRIATRLGVGGAIAIVVVLQMILPFAIPYIANNVDIEGLSLVEHDSPPDLSGGHFEGRDAKNTSPSQMDELMENW